MRAWDLLNGVEVQVDMGIFHPDSPSGQKRGAEDAFGPDQLSQVSQYPRMNTEDEGHVAPSEAGVQDLSASIMAHFLVGQQWWPRGQVVLQHDTGFVTPILHHGSQQAPTYAPMSMPTYGGHAELVQTVDGEPWIDGQDLGGHPFNFSGYGM